MPTTCDFPKNDLLRCIVQLDWSIDPVSEPVRMVSERLGLKESEAIKALCRFQDQHLIECYPEKPADNILETGADCCPPVRSRWRVPANS